MRGHLEQAIPNSDAKLEGLKKRTFVAKSFVCVLLVLVSIYVMVDNWSEMETSSNYLFKILGCSVSFVFLIPSLYDAALMAYMLMFLFDTDNATHDLFFEHLNEEFKHCCFGCCFLTICCPLAWSLTFYAYGCSFPVAGMVVGFLDIFQTLLLFPLSVVVIFTSESGVDIFVNVIAVQVFGNLDDIFAYTMTDRRWEIWKYTSTMYLRWLGGERMTPDHVDASAFNALSEKVLLIEKKMNLVDNETPTVRENSV